MALQDVIEQIRRIVATAPAITSSYAGVPERAPDTSKLPAAIARHDPERRGHIDLGTLEIWTHPIRIDVLVIEDGGNTAFDSTTAMPFVEAVIGALRGHATVNGLGALESGADYLVSQFCLWDKTYWGVSVLISVTEMFEAATLIMP
jgi:hypothetical protein